MSASSVGRAFERLGLPLKKTLFASERDERERAAWRERVTEIDPTRLIFVDECGTHTSMVRRYAKAPKGQRVCGSVPRTRGKDTTLVASLSLGGIGEAMVFEGATTKAVFETYLERVLVPVLKARAGSDHGQPRGTQGTEGSRVDRGEGSYPPFPAGLLAGLLAHRGSLLQDKGVVEESSG